MIPFREKLKKVLRENGITNAQFEFETGIDKRILYYDRKIHKSTMMGLAYYLNMRLEDLVEGTDAEDHVVR